jgi:hypothetical protein
MVHMPRRKNCWGRFGVFEATDLKHAIQLMSKNPVVKSGIVEIRLAENLARLIRESERRRATSLL